MKPDTLMAWVNVGLQLVTVLAVPVSQVIGFARQQGVEDADLVLLESAWATQVAAIEQRIAALKAQIAAGQS
jgi:hypothetical protein